MLEVDDDPFFGSPITHIVNAPTTFRQLGGGSLAYATEYSWRVTAVVGADELESTTWSLITQSAPRICAGDVTRDGVTNVLDFNVLAGHFGQPVAIGADGDLNDDMQVNVADFNILAGDFGCTE